MMRWKFSKILAHTALLTASALNLTACLGTIATPPPPPPPTNSLAAYQTPIRNQGTRAVCWAFAITAALEAAYKRDFGLELDLSEEYVTHIQKAGELFYDYTTNNLAYENNSSFWDAQGNAGSVMSLRRYAVPTENDAPYSSIQTFETLKNQLPFPSLFDDSKTLTQSMLDTVEFSERHIPSQARYHALYQIDDAAQIRNPSNDEIERVISEKHEVIAGFILNWALDKDTGIRSYDATIPNAGYHIMLIVAYDHDRQLFWLKNSWGGKELAVVTYEFVEKAIREASYIKSVKPVADPRAPQAQGMWLGHWLLNLPDQHGDFMIRRFTNFRASQEAPTKLGSFIENGESHDIEGKLENDGKTMAFTISAGTERAEPGMMIGKVYRATLDPVDGYHARGDGGVELNRVSLP
jgi:hypothetical protein